ncbi:SUKH-4 family immunity protein [Streptomyces sp. BH097]|uniref:SUKH-4 family immunity protein n=1 Tax=unclassified Streptomyces TaxID=2593676 RepID=UPI003BB5206B
MSSDISALLASAERSYAPRVELPLPVHYALQLWLAGVRPADRGEWAAWLHLAATAHADAEVAAEIDDLPTTLPWRVRWHHWRPPGAVSFDGWLPGPIERIEPAPTDWSPDGRPAVIGREYVSDESPHWAWDAASGRPLAGPSTGPLPTPGQSSPIGTFNEFTLPLWTDLGGPSRCLPLVTGHLRMDGLTGPTIYCSPGGVFAIDSTTDDPLTSACTNPPERPQTRTFPFDVVPGFDARTYGRHPDFPAFEAADFHRVPPADLPTSMGDHASRETLVEVGVPVFRRHPLELTPPRRRPHASTDEDDGTNGTDDLLPIGSLEGGTLVIECSTGVVYRLPPGSDGTRLGPWHPDENTDAEERTTPWFEAVNTLEDVEGPEDDTYVTWIAPDLATFLTLASRYIGIRSQLRMTTSGLELDTLSARIEVGLGSAVPMAMFSWWTATLKSVV